LGLPFTIPPPQVKKMLSVSGAAKKQTPETHLHVIVDMPLIGHVRVCRINTPSLQNKNLFFLMFRPPNYKPII
jgi:hypothetical protein